MQQGSFSFNYDTIYLLDSNVLITANNTYYPLERVPEYWSWLLFQSEQGRIKTPIEIYEEVLAGKKSDELIQWMTKNREVLILNEEVDIKLVQTVTYKGYAPDLYEKEIEKLGRDPFLLAYAINQKYRCVVTTEVSKPSKQRQNRKIPNVRNHLKIRHCNPFEFNGKLNFFNIMES